MPGIIPVTHRLPTDHPQPTVARSPEPGFRRVFEQEREAGDLDGAAKQFESLIIGQILKAAQSSANMSAVDGETEQSSSAMLEMAQECFAQAIAGQGGFGLARMIQDSMRRETAKSPSSE